MLFGVLTGLAVLGGIALLVVLFLQRGREGVDLSLSGVLRVYLYLASLAGVIAFAVGLAGILAYVLAAAFGLEVIYGPGQPRPVPAIAPVCPPNATCPPFLTPFPQQVIPDDRIRRQGEDLVRGATFVVFGGIFWGGHWFARRSLARVDERGRGVHAGDLVRGHAMLGCRLVGVPSS